MKIGIPKEIRPGERRVAATPDTVSRLIKLGFEVQVESRAGAGASFSDADYAAQGASIASGARELWQQSQLVLKVQPPEQNLELGMHEAELLAEGGILVSFVWPAKKDALRSMANIASYRAVIEAASFYGRFFTGQMTAAGKVAPAKVLVIGAGVAGLAAIGAARGLGAMVRAFDTRAEVREQVQSMGAEFLTVNLQEDGSGAGGYAKEMSKEFIAAEMALFALQAKEVDIIITTALIPGKPAPVLITTDMVKSMRQGSVIVDMAAEAGGNCALTQPGQVIEQHGVTVIGYVDLPSRLAPTASQLYGSNLTHLLADMGGAKSFHIDLEDEVVRGAIVLQKGELLWPPPRKEPPKPVERKERALSSPPPPAHRKAEETGAPIAVVAAAPGCLLLAGAVWATALGR